MTAKRIVILVLAPLLAIPVAVVLAYVGFVALVITSFPGTAHFPVECALVFGAAVRNGDSPGPGITRRVQAAVELHARGDVERFIFTGGRGDRYQTSEAEVMRTLAVELGIDPADTQIEDSSRSTQQNLLFARPLTEDCNGVVAVSDRYHLARIRYLAWLMGWGTLDTAPAEAAPSRAFEVRNVLREALGLGYYTLFGADGGGFDGGDAE
jgi:uncharacterized SAM-binding protein YcdF (DUF218 family)